MNAKPGTTTHVMTINAITYPIIGLEKFGPVEVICTPDDRDPWDEIGTYQIEVTYKRSETNDLIAFLDEYNSVYEYFDNTRVDHIWKVK